MKKYLALSLLILLFSCAKEKNENDSQLDGLKDEKKITLNLALSLVKSSSQTGTMQMTTMSGETKATIIDFSSYGCLQYTSTEPGISFRTHGVVTNATLYTKNNNGEVLGAGAAVRFPFKPGKSYSITLIAINFADEINGDQIESVKRRPTLQMQLTNYAPNATTGCAGDLSGPVTLIGPDPLVTIPMPNTNDSKTFVNNFTPDKCYEFLRLSALPNMAGASLGSVLISEIKIVETSNLVLNGPAFLDANEQFEYVPMFGGFTISDSFGWTVTGGLEIIGSTTGPTVTVKATNLSGGTIYGSFNGCAAVVSKVLPALNNAYITLVGPLEVKNNSTLPSRYDIVLSGPLVGKTITDTEWTIPSIYGMPSWQPTYLEVWPTGSTGGGFITANFLVDGSPAAVQRWVKVRRAY